MKQKRPSRIGAVGVVMTLLLMLLQMLPLSAAAYSMNGGIANNGLGGIWIDISAPPYSTNTNQYAYGPSGCAWFASNRFNELTSGMKIDVVWGPENWWNYGADSFGLTKSSSPADCSIMVWEGHVAILEKIVGNTAYISEGGNTAYPNNSYCVIKAVDVSEMTSHNSSFWGYLHIPHKDAPPLTTPKLSMDKPSYFVGETGVISWVHSDTPLLYHYWIGIDEPDGTKAVNEWVDKEADTYSFKFTQPGTYTIGMAATPVGSQEGEGSLTDTIQVNVIPAVKASFKGEGTEASPYQIGTAAQLRELATLCNTKETTDLFGTLHYALTADIDLGDELFTPIGTYTTEAKDNSIGFQGVFDGRYHKITGLRVQGDLRYTGLFGWCYKGTIRNLSVYGSTAGTDHVGGIAGEVGQGGSILNCSFNGTVKADTKAGGIAGTCWDDCTIESCYFNGTVEAGETACSGGIFGFTSINEGHTIRLRNCYTASSGKLGGGLIGSINDTLTYSADQFSIENCCYLSSSASQGVGSATVKGGKGLSADAMREAAADLLGMPFVTNQDAALNDGYPLFAWQAVPVRTGDVNGDGQLDVTDVVLLQKWLLAIPKTTLTNRTAAELCEDGTIDAFDLAVMKRRVIGK